MKYICKLGEICPYNYENPPICRVELWDFSRANECEEARKETVCLVASISYGNEYCKDPDRLWNLLIKKGEESPFEFVKTPEFEFEQSLRNTDFMTDKSWSIYAYGKETKRLKEDRLKRRRGRVATFKLKVPIFVAYLLLYKNEHTIYYPLKREKAKFEFWKPPQADNLNITNALATEYSLMCNLQKILLDKGLKPEQARAFLPLGLYTQFWMQGNYKTWLNFFIHHLHPETQEEARLVVQSMWELLKKNQPEIIETMADYLEKWIRDCNSIFQSAREEKARCFKETYLGG